MCIGKCDGYYVDFELKVKFSFSLNKLASISFI